MFLTVKSVPEERFVAIALENVAEQNSDKKKPNQYSNFRASKRSFPFRVYFLRFLCTRAPSIHACKCILFGRWHMCSEVLASKTAGTFFCRLDFFILFSSFEIIYRIFLHSHSIKLLPRYFPELGHFFVASFS